METLVVTRDLRLISRPALPHTDIAELNGPGPDVDRTASQGIAGVGYNLVGLSLSVSRPRHLSVRNPCPSEQVFGTMWRW